MSHDAWVFVGGFLTVLVTTIGTVVVAQISTHRKVADVEEGVAEVRRLAEPTGNGFAAATLKALGEIQHEQREVRDLLTDHLAAHASADLTRPAVRSVRWGS